MSAPAHLMERPAYQPQPIDPETWVPSAPFMRVIHCAPFLSYTANHVLSLIREGIIKVPKKLQKSAPSGPAMRIPRASIIKFVRERSSLTRQKRRPVSVTREKKGKKS